MALGSDFKGDTDLDPSMREAFGQEALMDCIVRRLNTEAGSLQDFPLYGHDLNQYIGRIIDDPQIVADVVFDQCMQEEEVTDAAGDAEFENGVLTLEVQIFSDEGSFSLTISVDDLTVEMIIPRL